MLGCACVSLYLCACVVKGASPVGMWWCVYIGECLCLCMSPCESVR
jgi:hypothetical protein